MSSRPYTQGAASSVTRPARRHYNEARKTLNANTARKVFESDILYILLSQVSPEYKPAKELVRQLLEFLPEKES